MITTTTFTWFDTVKKEAEKSTPESLRAAAKVLEDKAKELENPKYTKRQQAHLDGTLGIQMDCLATRGTDRAWHINGSASCAESFTKHGEGWTTYSLGDISVMKVNGVDYPTITYMDEIHLHWNRL